MPALGTVGTKKDGPNSGRRKIPFRYHILGADKDKILNKETSKNLKDKTDGTCNKSEHTRKIKKTWS